MSLTGDMSEAYPHHCVHVYVSAIKQTLWQTQRGGFDWHTLQFLHLHCVQLSTKHTVVYVV